MGKRSICVSFFLAQKPDKSCRFILNLKKLNEFISPCHFKMEDVRTATKLIFPNNFMCPVDLEDAYYLVPIHRDSRKFLRFAFQGNLYQFRCLPFGLCSAPFVFTKILKPAMRFLRRKGLASVIYLDDILCIGQSVNECAKNTGETIRLLESLGFLINWRKSALNPSTKCKFLGFVINTSDFV